MNILYGINGTQHPGGGNCAQTNILPSAFVHKSISNFEDFPEVKFATELALKGLISGIFPFLGANIQDGIYFIKHDYF